MSCRTRTSGLRNHLTYEGNRPVTRAIYSLRTVPATNSSVTKRARSADSGMIIRPDVSRSNLLTARSCLSMRSNISGGKTPPAYDNISCIQNH